MKTIWFFSSSKSSVSPKSSTVAIDPNKLTSSRKAFLSRPRRVFITNRIVSEVHKKRKNTEADDLPAPVLLVVVDLVSAHNSSYGRIENKKIKN